MTLQKTTLAQVAAPVFVGLMWQLVIKVARVLWPAFEKNADRLVSRAVRTSRWLKRRLKQV